MSHDDETPVACGLTADQQTERRRQLQGRLLRGVRQVRELDDGYAMRFDWSPDRVGELGELVALESACCPFLRLRLEVSAGHGRVWLALTGPPGTRELLRRFAGDVLRDAGSPSSGPG